MPRMKMVQIDGEKLSEAVKQTNLSASTISKILTGNKNSHGVVREAIGRNQIAVKYIDKLELLGITFDSIKPDEDIRTESTDNTSDAETIADMISANNEVIASMFMEAVEKQLLPEIENRLNVKTKTEWIWWDWVSPKVGLPTGTHMVLVTCKEQNKKGNDSRRLTLAAYNSNSTLWIETTTKKIIDVVAWTELPTPCQNA